MSWFALVVVALVPALPDSPGGSADAGRASAGAARLLELTEVARLFPRHKGPTVIYLNFDGWIDYDARGHDVLPYQPGSGSRDRAIQLILFRTAEKFAPFDVEVRRLRGDGACDRSDRGNTTVFIGADTANDGRPRGKYAYARTPGRFVDGPVPGRGHAHRPNSDPFDLAFVDPVGEGDDPPRWATVWSEDHIARNIAHEAGHTFGLTHTATAPVPDLMSYDAPNRFFANRAFRISGQNNNGKKVVKTDQFLPSWEGEVVATQNAYTYLRAVLGPRRADDGASVADQGAVDPVFVDSPLIRLAVGQSHGAAIERCGDYDVFVLEPARHGRLAVRVRPTADSPLVPVVFLFDATGRRLLRFGSGSGQDGCVAQLVAQGLPGHTYKVVVGAADSASAGGYEVGVDAAPAAG
jgi:hypothetical protein